MICAYSGYKVYWDPIPQGAPGFARTEFVIGGLMFVTMKVSSLAYSLQDGSASVLAAMKEELTSTHSVRSCTVAVRYHTTLRRAMLIMVGF